MVTEIYIAIQFRQSLLPFLRSILRSTGAYLDGRYWMRYTCPLVFYIQATKYITFNTQRQNQHSKVGTFTKNSGFY
jgi:hypothetical protein